MSGQNTVTDTREIADIAAFPAKTTLAGDDEDVVQHQLANKCPLEGNSGDSGNEKKQRQ